MILNGKPTEIGQTHIGRLHFAFCEDIADTDAMTFNPVLQNT